MEYIKFRAKDKNTGIWLYGTGITDFINVHPELKAFWIWSDYRWIQVDPETVGKYAGVKDKNGKEYFVGDKGRFDNGDSFILKMEDWLEVYCDWVGDPECEDQTRDLYRISLAEIVGDIYE